MKLTPDQHILYQVGPIALTSTVAYTWFVMVVLVGGSWFLTRRLTPEPEITPGQNLLETLISGILDQIREVTQQEPLQYLPFAGTLFLFIAASNLLSIIPLYHPPTASLSTTTALALSVFVAVPYYGIRARGVWPYLVSFAQPSIFMLPFNILGELTGTVALAIRLFGNVMSGGLVVAIVLSIAPFFFPILVQLLELLIGLVQAYIFSVLALVFIASATRAHQDRVTTKGRSNQGESSHG